MSNNISAIRAAVGNYMVDGKLSRAEAKDLGALAKKGNAADKALVTAIFKNDRFEDGVNFKQIARDSGLGKIKKQAPIMNAKVGSGIDPDTKGEVAAKVAAVIGDTKGYPSKYQAIAAVRLNYGYNATVVEQKGRWYAVQTTPAVTKPASGTTPIAPIDLAKYEEAKQIENPTERYTKLASMAFGVPESEINVFNTKKGGKPDSTKINVDLHMDTKDDGQTGTDGEAVQGRINTKAATVSLSTGLFDSGPMRAATTLFHEGQHAADRGLATDLLNKKLGGKFNVTKYNELVDGTKNQKLMDEEFVMDGNSSHKHLIEARAYAAALVESAEFDKPGMKVQIVGLGAELDDGGIKKGSDEFKALAKDLRAGFDQLGNYDQDHVLDAIKDELKNHPDQRDMLIEALTK